MTKLNNSDNKDTKMEDTLKIVSEVTEYFAFNRMPKEPVPEQHLWMFTDPVRLFGSGEYGRKEAERWVAAINTMRWTTRRTNGKGLEVDDIAGELVDLVVKSQKVVRYDYQPVE